MDFFSREESGVEIFYREGIEEEGKYNSDGSLNYKNIYQYDSDGNRIEQVKYKGDILMPKSFISWIFEYYN